MDVKREIEELKKRIKELEIKLVDGEEKEEITIELENLNKRLKIFNMLIKDMAITRIIDNDEYVEKIYETYLKKIESKIDDIYLEQENISYVEDVFLGVDKDLVEAIDADDNGVFPKIEAEYKVKTLSNIIKLFNPSYGSIDDENHQFLKAVTIAREILQEEIKTVEGKVKAKYKLLDLISNNETNILILNEYMPYEETLLQEDKDQRIGLYRVFRYCC